MNESLVRILYFGPVEKPRIHFTIGYIQDEGVGSQHWDQYAMKPTNRGQIYEIELLLDSDQYLEFVFCGIERGDQLVWENPRGDQQQKFVRRNNFFVEITGTYAIFEGFIVKVSPQPILQSPLVLFTDIDGTLFGQNRRIFQEFKKFYISSGLYDHPDFTLVYSTGRGIKKFKSLFIGERLPTPDYLISSCGTEVYTINKKDLTFILNEEWKEYITMKQNSWDVRALYAFVAKQMPELKISPKEDINELQGGFVVEEQYVRDTSRLDKLITEANLALGNNWKYIVSGNGSHRFVDIVPDRADKGSSLRFLCKRVLLCDQAKTVAFGDSTNDIEMLIQAGRGFVVANSQPELLQWVQENSALYPTISVSPYQEAEAIQKYLLSILKYQVVRSIL